MDYEYVKLTYYKDFGDMLSQKRKVLGMSIRKLSSEVSFDPGNMSKIERGKLKPPTDIEVLSKWAEALQIERDSFEYFKFIDYAYITHRMIPDDIPLKFLINHLSSYFRNIRNRKPLRMKDIDPHDID